MAYGWLILRTLIVLLAVLALAYAALRLLAKHLGRTRQTEPGNIEVLERQLIEPRRSLLVVRTAGECWLLSSTEQGITPVGKLDPTPWLRSDEIAATSEIATQDERDAISEPKIAPEASLIASPTDARIPAPQAELIDLDAPSNAHPPH